MRRHRLPVLMLVLAAGGMFLMHGPDAGAHGAPRSPTGPSEMAMQHPEADLPGPAAHLEAPRPAEAPSDSDARTLGSSGHIMALCMAVLAIAGGQALRHVAAHRRGLPTTVAPVMPTWRARLPRTLRPPGPRRLELCVQIC